MENENRVIPFKAASLIIGYLHNSLSESQKDELDEWICDSDENMKVFEGRTLGFDNDIFDPMQFMIETEEATELWIIAGLIIRQQQQTISEIEQKVLGEWTNASERNRRLFEELRNPRLLQKLIAWSCVHRKDIADLN